MASSGTYAYAPDVGDVTEEAFERCGLDPALLVYRHQVSARRSMNLLFADWANKGVQLFAVDEQTTPALVAGTASYTATTGTLQLLDCFIRRDNRDTPVYKMTRDEYAAIPDKTLGQGLPSKIWLDRASGVFYLWQVPENATDVLHYWRLRRLQDVTAGQETPDVVYRYFEALAAGLAAKLAVKFAPDRLSVLKAEAAEALASARLGDVEHADTTMSISMMGLR